MQYVPVKKADPAKIGRQLGVRVLDCMAFLDQAKRLAPRAVLVVDDHQIYFNPPGRHLEGHSEHTIRLIRGRHFTLICGGGWTPQRGGWSAIPEGGILNRTAAETYVDSRPGSQIVPEGRLRRTLATLMEQTYSEQPGRPSR